MTWIKTQWSRKFGWCFVLELIATFMWVLTEKVSTDQWSNFTIFLTGVLFVANSVEKFAPKQSGQLFNGDGK